MRFVNDSKCNGWEGRVNELEETSGSASASNMGLEDVTDGFCGSTGFQKVVQ